MLFQRFFSFLVIAFAVLPALSTSAQETSEPLPGAERVQDEVQQWVETRQLISRESAEWEAERNTLKRLNEIRQSEIEQLGEFIEAAGSRVDELETRREQFAKEEEELKAWRKELESRVIALEKQLSPRLGQFPPPLQDKVNEAVLRLESLDPERPLQHRTRDVLLILQALVDFQHAITLDGEIREIGGQQRQVDVIYLGLTQAWYVDRTGNFAGTGQPTDGGWVWQEDATLAPRIRAAIEIQSRQAPPALITLPLLNQTPTDQ